MVWLLVLADWGASGVQLYASPGTGLRWECGFMGARGVRSGDHGIPGPEEFHRWFGLDVGGELVEIGARIGLGGGDGLGQAVAALVGLVGAVSGSPWGSSQVSSIVVRYVNRRPW